MSEGAASVLRLVVDIVSIFTELLTIGGMSLVFGDRAQSLAGEPPKMVFTTSKHGIHAQSLVPTVLKLYSKLQACTRVPETAVCETH